MNKKSSKSKQNLPHLIKIHKNSKKCNWSTKNIPINNSFINKKFINKPKFKLPKQKKSSKSKYFDKSILNKSIRIKTNAHLKPKTNVTTIAKRKLPQWTLRLTKFDHYVSSQELMIASVKEQTSKSYLSYGKSFYAFINEIRANQDDLPLIEDILNNFDIFQLDALIYEFLTAKFNAKNVTGGTLHNTACGILYTLAVDFGISLTCELLPGTRKICKGADNYLREKYGDHPKGKYPILNPILEKMLDVASPRERFALLLAQRFCLRS